MDVHAGEERFLSELGPWSVLGQKALGVDEYIPDFDARATGGCRMLRIHADAYRLALRMGKTDQIVGVRAMRQLTQVISTSLYIVPSSTAPCCATHHSTLSPQKLRCDAQGHIAHIMHVPFHSPVHTGCQ